MIIFIKYASYEGWENLIRKLVSKGDLDKAEKYVDGMGDIVGPMQRRLAKKLNKVGIPGQSINLKERLRNLESSIENYKPSTKSIYDKYKQPKGQLALQAKSFPGHSQTGQFK